MDMDMYKVIWGSWLACCVVSAGGCLVISAVSFFNSRRLSRPTLMSLNVVIVSSMTVFLNGFMLVGIQHPFLCKLCRVVIQYLVMALPGTVLVLNIYCFIWTRYPDIDARRVTPHIVVAFAVSPHVVSILINTGLLAFSFVELVSTELTCYWAEANIFHKLVMICIDSFIPCILNTIIVFTLICNCISLYQKSNQREGAMRNAMIRRVQIVLAVAVLNLLQFLLIQPAMAEPILETANYHLLYIMYLAGHAVTVLWWLVLLPDARAFLLAGLKMVFKAVFKRKYTDSSESITAPLNSPTDPYSIHTDNGDIQQLDIMKTADHHHDNPQYSNGSCDYWTRLEQLHRLNIGVCPPTVTPTQKGDGATSRSDAAVPNTSSLTAEPCSHSDITDKIARSAESAQTVYPISG